MSSLFDAPVHLLMILSAVVAGREPAALDTRAAVRAEAEVSYAFSDDVWLSALQRGFGGEQTERFRDRIFTTSGGRIYVPILSERQEILKARRRAVAAHAVAVDLAHYNFVELRRRLGQSPGVKELYAAHVFGLEVASNLPVLVKERPSALVTDALPAVAAAFPEAAAKRATVADFYKRLPGAIGVENGMVANAASAQHDRLAPLRGVINSDRDQAASGEREPKVATLGGSADWLTVVKRAQ